MTITIEAKPLEVKAELPGYGLFYLRRLGAGAEADIRERLAKAQDTINEIKDKYSDLIDEETKLIEAKDEKALTEFRSTDKFKEAADAQAEANKVLQDAAAFATQAQLKLWRSDDPEAMERLLNDFTADEIRGFYMQVMGQANNA